MNPFPAMVRTIAIPAPAGIPERHALECSLALLNSWGIETRLGHHVYDDSEESYYAATLRKRADDFNRFLHDSAIDLILCARGGYGSAHILTQIDWDCLRERKLPVLGYSDITALHLGMLAKNAGVPVTTQMAAHLFESSEDPVTALSMKRTLEGLYSSFRETVSLPLQPLNEFEGVLQGRIIAANLSLLASLCGTEYLPDFNGAVLLLEDIGEKPRIIDRHLLQLCLASIPQRCAAVVFGQFTDCGGDGDVLRILERLAFRIDTPLFHSLLFGHSLPSHSFICGERAVIDKGILYLER